MASVDERYPALAGQFAEARKQIPDLSDEELDSSVAQASVDLRKHYLEQGLSPADAAAHVEKSLAGKFPTGYKPGILKRAAIQTGDAYGAAVQGLTQPTKKAFRFLGGAGKATGGSTREAADLSAEALIKAASLGLARPEDTRPQGEAPPTTGGGVSDTVASLPGALLGGLPLIGASGAAKASGAGISALEALMTKMGGKATPFLAEATGQGAAFLQNDVQGGPVEQTADIGEQLATNAALAGLMHGALRGLGKLSKRPGKTGAAAVAPEVPQSPVQIVAKPNGTFEVLYQAPDNVVYKTEHTNAREAINYKADVEASLPQAPELAQPTLPTSYLQKQEGSALDNALDQISYGRGVEQPTKDAFSRFVGTASRVRNFAETEAQFARTIPEAERVNLKKFAENKDATPESVAQVSPAVAQRMVELKSEITPRTQKLVELGMLDQSQADAHVNKYVNRAVLQSAVNEPTLAKRFADAQAELVADGFSPAEAAQVANDIYAGKGSPLLTQKNQIGGRTGALKKRTLKSPALRALRGEVQDGTAAIINTIGEQENLIARGELLSDITDHIDAGLYDGYRGRWETLGSDVKENVRLYGKFAGRSVPKPVHELLKLHTNIQTQTQSIIRTGVGWASFWNTAGSLKYPATQFVENFWQSNLGGSSIANLGNWKYYTEALRQLKNNGPQLAALRAAGGMENFFEHEIRNVSKGLELESLLKSGQMDGLSLMQKLGDLAKKGAEKTRQVGNFSDSLFKLANFIKASGGVDGKGKGIRLGDIHTGRQKMVTDRFHKLANEWRSASNVKRLAIEKDMAREAAQAVQNVDKHFINFSKPSPIESKLRESTASKLIATPFAVAKGRATAIWVNALKEKPLLTSALIAGAYGAKSYSNRLHGVYNGDGLDTLIPFTEKGKAGTNAEQMQKEAPAYMRDRHALVLPALDKNGDVQQIDYERYMPLSMLSGLLTTQMGIEDPVKAATRFQQEVLTGYLTSSLPGGEFAPRYPPEAGLMEHAGIAAHSTLTPQAIKRGFALRDSLYQEEPERLRSPQENLINMLSPMNLTTLDETPKLRMEQETDRELDELESRRNQLENALESGRMSEEEFDRRMQKLEVMMQAIEARFEQ